MIEGWNFHLEWRDYNGHIAVYMATPGPSGKIDEVVFITIANNTD